MNSESSTPHSSGRMIRVGQPLPAIEVDCSDWSREAGPLPSGHLVRVCESLLPAEMDFTREGMVLLELTFILGSGANANQVRDKVVRLFERADDYERSLGGAGFHWENESTSVLNGRLRVILTPNDSVNAVLRLEKLAKLVANVAIDLPAVSALTARVYRTAEPDRPLFEIRESAA
jgi:hypothetical protein